MHGGRQRAHRGREVATAGGGRGKDRARAVAKSRVMTDRTIQIPDEDLVAWRRQRLCAAGFAAALADEVVARVRDGPARAARPRRPRLPARPRGPDPRPARHGAPAVLSPAASVAPVTAAPPPPGFPDADSETWVIALGGAAGPARDAAVARLHALLLRAARFELRRRGTRVDVDDLATQAADDALLAILAKLRHLPRPEPVHDVGVQVRAPRGGGEGAAAGLAGPRGRARRRRLGARRGARPRAGRRRRDRRAAARRAGRRSRPR